jgi:hypothetical protein
LTPLSEADLSARLGKSSFTATRIDARSDTTGYLFYPLGDYVRARVQIIDTETEEAEGFAVEF